MIRNLQLGQARAVLLAAALAVALAALALIAALGERGDRSLISDGVHMIPMTLSEGAAVNDQGALPFSDDDSRETGLISPATLGGAGLALSTALFIALARRRNRPRYIDPRGQRPQARPVSPTCKPEWPPMIRNRQLSRTRPALLAAALAALALIAALAVPTALPGGSASAQAPEDEALTALQRTHVVAEIPEQYNEPFPLQWGGGSLYQLKQRLATMNCIADTVWVHQNNQWHGYNQYQVPSTLNAQFIETYSEFIPAGTLYASCYDICEFNYYDAPRTEPCVSSEEMRERNFYNALTYPVDQNNPCTTFDSRVQANVTPVMPLYPDVCLIRQDNAPTVGADVLNPITILSNALYPYYPSVVALYTKPAMSPNNKVKALWDEIHELCHTNQDWQFIQNLQPDNIRRADLSSTEIWRTTWAGREFIDLVGFTQNANGEWTLPDNTYDDIFAVSPIELAAELCTMYFIDAMGEPSQYDSMIYEQGTGYQWREYLIDFDSSPYLTPEVREWVETYIVLPN